ncbi:MAG: hypothetical protein IJS14_13405 [Lentisphaeria bacterium]|nr:hypothetical protein [Lentisphaeria bacterium]
MNNAYLLLGLLCLLWTLVAIVLSEAKQRGASVDHFYCFGSTTAVILLLLAGYTVNGLDNFFAPEYRVALLCFIAAALFNGSGQALCMSNLQQGGRALAYSIPQLAFLLPYTWSLVFWREHLSWHGVAGVLMIAAALLYLATRRSAKDGDPVHSSALEPKRILIAFAAMFLIGGGQILMSTPTRFSAGSRLSPWSGACILQAANALFFLGRSLIVRGITRPQLKCSLRGGLLWGLFAAASYATLLPTLRLLGEMKQAGLVFPVGSSMTILLFSGFTVIRFREKLTLRQWAAFAAVVAGIFLVNLG